MDDTPNFRCSRCGRQEDAAGRVPRPPFPNALGRRVTEEVCAECWEEWKRRQMLLINHYGLDLQEERAREFLYDNLRHFLFGEGEATAEIDPSQEGTVEW